MELLEFVNPVLETLPPIVAMERNHVGLFDLDLRHGRQLFESRPVTRPDPAGERLNRMGRTRKCKPLKKQSENQLSLICRLEFYVRRIFSVVGLVPHIPGQDAGIVGKSSDHALDVGPEARILAEIGEDRSSRWCILMRPGYVWSRT
jgi:hypothetical protein